MTFLACILHLLVDGVCALSMMGVLDLRRDPLLFFLIYNFCAFALQMPVGLLMDYVNTKLLEKILTQEDRDRANRMQMKRLMLPSFMAMCGILLCVVGAVLHPAILGLGNACFHVGAGVNVIWHDKEYQRNGVELGLFVAPGALGLFLGRSLASYGILSITNRLLLASSILMMFLGILLLFGQYRKILLKQVQNIVSDLFVYTDKDGNPSNEDGKTLTKDVGLGRIGKAELLLILCLFLIVVIRSFAGMGLNVLYTLPGFGLLGIISVSAVVVGKILGGVWAAKVGEKKALITSLSIAAVFYLLSGLGSFLAVIGNIAGVLALLFFNMSMPITLYGLVKRFYQLPGFFFGLLTFGLFIGYLPIAFGLVIGSWSWIVGALISLGSVGLYLMGSSAIDKKMTS